MYQTPAKQFPCLELGHLYAPQRAVSLSGMELHWDEVVAIRERYKEITAGVREKLKIPENLPLARMGFLDTVEITHQQRTSEEPARWGLFIGVSAKSLQAVVEGEVYFESSFIDEGRRLVRLIQSKATKEGLIDTEGNLRLKTNHGDIVISLTGFKGVPDPSHPSCIILDLAWTLFRHSNFTGVYTVLPATYRKQQLSVAALASFLQIPNTDRIVSFFSSKKGALTSMLRWSEVVT